jgi:hypothetical protein
MLRPTILLALPLLLASCKEQTSNPGAPSATEIIEVLKHHEGTFTRDRRIKAGDIGTSFNVDDVDFTITQRWPHAETSRNVTDDGGRPNHAVEVSWTEDGDEHTRWIFQTDSDDAMSPIEPLNALVRLTPPGARPPRPDDDSFTGQVQIQSNGLLLDLPDIGREVFEGWTLEGIRRYRHALMDDQGGVTEAADSGFTNRVLEVHLTDGKGTGERHLAFLDHPEITRGIHPTILPVSRVSGTGASNSRLVVCTPVPPAAERHIVQVSPNAGLPGLTIRVWLAGESDSKSVTTDQLPVDLPLTDGKSLHLTRHFSKARSEIKWERRDSPQAGDAKPALLVEHRASHHQKDAFVLIDGEVTPCRIGPKHIMLRYSKDGSTPVPVVTPPSADSGKTPGTAPAPRSPPPPAPSS